MSQKTADYLNHLVFSNGRSVLKKSTDEFLRMRISMFCCQITTNSAHLREISDVFLLHKALQYSFSTRWAVL
jgi:hypothetical protein